jgi:alginate O-acetyltransferase complex protein AlgI
VLFPTIDFAIFFVIVLTASWLLMRRRGWWRCLMLGASAVFYGWWDWRFLWLLGASAIANHITATAIGRLRSLRTRKFVLVVAITVNLGVLAWFKYYGFLVTSVANTLATLGIHIHLPLLQVVLPVGISFFTFHALSYVIDVYRRVLRPATLQDFTLYLAFFPHLVAGPIVRAKDFLPQLRYPRDPRKVDGARAFWLITAGLFKKVVVANLLATRLVDPVFANPGLYSAPDVLAAIYGYAVQIFADFSGYTDIAIGCALLLGFQFPQNFDRPYTAVSLQDFWRRWHITLSNWLRDYLYIPLGGSRESEAKTTRNLMATMLLGGLWHGAAWTFVVWGGIHGAVLAIERRIIALRTRKERDCTHRQRGRSSGRTGIVRHPLFGWAVTFNVVCLAWVFFRAESFSTAGTMLTRLATGWGPAQLCTPALVLLIAGSLAMQFSPPGLGLQLQAAFSRLGPLPQAAILAAALFVIDALGPQGVAPFIYFQF